MVNSALKKENADSPRLFIMAGGTGGHVFPALAVADYLRTKGVTIEWMGTQNGIEAKVVPANNIRLHCINIAGIRGKSLRQFLRGPIVILRAIAEARAILKIYRPQVVLGMGGYASGPGAIAAKSMGIPIIIHEQNARAGGTNKILAKIARKILVGFPYALPRSEYVGNPVRDIFYQQPSPDDRFVARGTQKKILVLGGSLGAQALNKKVPEALMLLPETLLTSLGQLNVIHQAGARNLQMATEAYFPLSSRTHVTVELSEFINDVAAAMAAADLIICRAGALTIAELSAVGAASILVPFPHAIDDHQTANARWLSDKGAAILYAERDITSDGLANQISMLLSDPKRLNDMANRALARTDKSATEKVADYCLEYLHV